MLFISWARSRAVGREFMHTVIWPSMAAIPVDDSLVPLWRLVCFEVQFVPVRALARGRSWKTQQANDAKRMVGGATPIGAKFRTGGAAKYSNVARNPEASTVNVVF